jgi:hypothetical protein
MSGTLTLVIANRMMGRGKGCITHLKKVRRQRKCGPRRSKQAKLWSSRGALCVYAAKSRSLSRSAGLASRRSDLATGSEVATADIE